MSRYRNPIPKLDGQADIKGSIEDINELENDYSFEQSVYFAFIDVLGFKKTFDDNRKENNNKFAEVYKDVFNYYFKLMNASEFMYNSAATECYLGQISDSLYFYTTRSDMLMKFIKSFYHFNLYSMSKNVFVRGGIAKGNLFKNQNQGYRFYGDSVIKAHLLESIVSRDPIMVIDENTYQDIMSYTDCNILIGNCKERHYIRPFVNCEDKIKPDIVPNSLFNLEAIDKDIILNNIIDNKKLFEYENNNFGKYVFLEKEFDDNVNKTK